MAKNKVTDGKVFGGGMCDVPVNAPALIDILASYKRRIAGLYRPLAPADIPSIPPGTLGVSRKLDGELWFLISDEQRIYLLNPRGRSINGQIPVLEQAKRLVKGTIIAGELYAEPVKGRERVGDLSTLLAGGKKAATERLMFAAFDLVQRDGVSSLNEPYEERFKTLGTIIADSDNNLTVIDTVNITTSADLQAHYNAIVTNDGAEGLIVRASSGMVYKIKPVIDIDCVIMAYTEKVDEPGHARSVLLGLMHEDGKIQLLGGCGNLGSMEQRKMLFDLLSKATVSTQVRYASDSGGLYQFVAPKTVVSIKVTDLQAEKSDGSLCTTPLLSYDANNGWTGNGVRACPRPIHPVLERLREDKSVTLIDVRFSQVANWMAAESTDQNLTEQLPTSKVVRREVWTKETKGQVAVRKLVVWKTNKDKASAAFPAFVVHWTDYSASRGTPLDREVRLAPTEKLAMELAEEMIAANIKKGWNKV